LIDLYNSTNGASWTTKTNWLGAAGTENTWFGVTTDTGNTTVRQLILHNNNLVGTLPSSLGQLSNVYDLELYSNQLTGSIPTELSNLSNLVFLYLYSNQLTGSIPTELGNLSNLIELRLSYNQLTGSIPSSLGNLSNLRILWIAFNQLTGSIPPELGNLSNLEYLYLNSNQLTGSIPGGLVSSLDKWVILDLHLNQLTGNIPYSLYLLSKLQVLELASNQLTGSIPSSLGNLSNLVTLNLFINSLGGNIPASLGNLSQIEILNFHSNAFSGSLPSELGNLSKLVTLNLYNNYLSGSIPPSLGNLSNLETLDVSSNALKGSLPTSLTNLTHLGTGLSYFNINYNALYTSDAGLIAFLNSRYAAWRQFQTIAPTNVSAVPGSSSVTVSWTPITYTGNTGGYRVFYATIAGGPYTFYAQTADKNASSQLVTGLTLGIPYYFVVQTRTDAHASNKNMVDSETSDEASATPGIPATITVTSPNGGESWVGLSLHNITWTSTGISNVKIEYSTDNGTNWTTIVASTANTGTYPWAVPNIPSAQCLVRVSDASNALVNDVSDGVFTIIGEGASKKVDFNGDGQDDILWRYYGSGGYNAVWFLGSSGATSSSPLPMFASPLEASPRSLFRNSGSKLIYPDARDVSLGGKEGFSLKDPREFGGKIATNVPLFADPRDARGVNSKKDILFLLRSFIDPRHIQYALNIRASGVSILGGASLPSVSDLNWQIVGTGDFNGDGQVDILWRYNESGGYNAVWYMTGATLTGAASLPSVSDLNWQIVGTGDFNGDGQVDILWRYNGSGGANAVWYMNGTTLTGGADVPSLADLLWKIVNR
jgi:Leucine-rich repeat (LRR) protein